MMHTLSIVSDVDRQGLRRFLDALGAIALPPQQLEVVLTHADWKESAAAGLLNAPRQRHPRLLLRCADRCSTGAAGMNAGLELATGEWIVFHAASQPWQPHAWRRLKAFLRLPDDPSLALAWMDTCGTAGSRTSGRGLAHWPTFERVPIDRLEAVPSTASHICFRRALLGASGLRFDPDVRAGFETAQLALRYLLAVGGGRAVALPAADRSARSPCRPAQFAASVWSSHGTYAQAIVSGYLQPLEEATRLHGSAPGWLQQALLLDLQAYFATDMRARAPTAVVSEPMAVEFHDLVRKVMQHIDVQAIEQLDAGAVSPEVKHALMSYKDLPCHSPVALTAYDHDQGLARLSYRIHGRRPAEAFLVDGRPAAAAYAKYRSCRFFRRTLFSERIAWLPAAEGRSLEVLLDGRRSAVSVEQQGATMPQASQGGGAGELLLAARSAFAPGKGRQRRLPANASGLKAGVLLWLARRRSVRREFARAWIFVDRDEQADDNAEHLCRWVMRHHPEINAWFLLDPSSPDWKRLADEGFRLVPPGLRRKLLLLNSEHIASSQPLYVLGGFDPARYGTRMNWRFTFLQHGVTKDDMSHWLSNQPFDIFVTSSPAEHASIVDDDTPYTYTGRETLRSGFPRHDTLLQIARRTAQADIDTVVIMPTWRGSLAARADAAGADAAAFSAEFRASDYARHWRDLLSDDALREVAERHGKRLVFMPHPNAAPYLDCFDLPSYVQVIAPGTAGIQKLFCCSAAMITDYSSVAFDMAYLRRPVVYYQFDRESFFRGAHNWREGYYDYDRDGFGPVARRHADVAGHLDTVLSATGQNDYLLRMENALPDRDGGACQRVYEAMLQTRRRVVASDNEDA